MNKSRMLVLFFIFCFDLSSYHVFAAEDSQAGKVMQLESEKLALENKIAEMNEATAARNMGYYIGLASAMLGFLGGIYGFYHQYRKTKIATQKLEVAYKELKETQDQLVKTEKMAAFGLMATRLSHEILNPLNFVNNFSELSKEILAEISDEKSGDNHKENIDQLNETLDKINEHGKRATSIIKQIQELSTKGMAHEFFEPEGA